MTAFLIAAFVIMLLVGRAAIPWSLGFVIGVGLLIYILGGF